jgi:hypothetical protein
MTIARPAFGPALAGWIALASLAGTARPATDERRDDRRLKRALFVSMGTLAGDKKAAEQAFLLIGKLRSPELARIGARIVQEDFDGLRASRLRALEAARDAPDPDRERVLQRIRARPFLQVKPPPFKVLIPAEFSRGEVEGPRDGTSRDFVYVEEERLVEEIGVLSGGIADLKPLRSIMFGNFKAILSQGIRAKGRIVREDNELTPDLKHNILRRVVFLQLGVFGSDPNVFDNAMSSLADDLPWIKDERRVIIAEIPRFCQIKRTWLKDVVIPRLRSAGDEERVEFAIPREVWVEDAARVYKAIEYFTRGDIPLLEYQAEMLANPGASSGLSALTPEQKQVVYLAAVKILSSYDAAAKPTGPQK